MATKSTSTRRRARPSNHAVTAAEHDEAVRVLLEGGQLDSVRQMFFCDNQLNMPIAGTPRPKPCPFCGEVDCSIVFSDEGARSAHVQCDNCMAETGSVLLNDSATDGGSYGLALAAARLWNDRNGGKS